jgi:ribose 5-phosphate isomerase B
MSELPLSQRNVKRIGIASDHGGFEMKEYIVERLRQSGFVVTEYGNRLLEPGDDYPDYVIPLARAVACEKVDRGIAICGSGVGACVAANKIAGIRACLVQDTFSARQGVEDDNMNLLCLGGRTLGIFLGWELVKAFLEARYTDAERHQRRIAKVSELETGWE